MVSYMWWIVTLSLRCTVFWDIELEIRVMGHSRSSVPTSIDLPHYDFLLMFRSNHRTISFRDRRQFQSENRQFSPPPVYLGSSLTGFPLEFGIGARARGQKTRMMGLPDGRKSFKIFSRSDTIVVCKVFVQTQRIFNMYSNGHGVHSNGHGNSKNI